MSTEFFNEAFSGYTVPPGIRAISETICSTFNIRGTADPMYIANVFAYELKVGDGQHNFYDDTPDMDRVAALVSRLSFAYSTNTDGASGVDVLDSIIRDGIFNSWGLQ
jgi:hypothetical protein